MLFKTIMGIIIGITAYFIVCDQSLELERESEHEESMKDSDEVEIKYIPEGYVLMCDENRVPTYETNEQNNHDWTMDQEEEMANDPREGAYFYLTEKDNSWEWKFLTKDRDTIFPSDVRYVYDRKLAEKYLPKQVYGEVILAKWVREGEVKFV